MSDKFDVFTPSDPHIADVVQQSEKRIEELEQSNKKLFDKAYFKIWEFYF